MISNTRVCLRIYKAMKKWIDDTETLKFLKPGVLIGKGRKSNFTGSGGNLNAIIHWIYACYDYKMASDLVLEISFTDRHV